MDVEGPVLPFGITDWDRDGGRTKMQMHDGRLSGTWLSSHA
jgi:hypothetical protein